MDRMVQNLRQGGWFSGLAGLVVGGMTDMHDKDPTDPFGRTAEAIISEAIGDVEYPVCFGFPHRARPGQPCPGPGCQAKLSVTPGCDAELRRP